MRRAKTCPKGTSSSMSARSGKKPKLPKRKSINELKKELWTCFSRWVRLRDGLRCYTCGKQIQSLAAAHAGHYVPQSRGSALRYDGRNVHCQCMTCNTFRRGNLYNYALRLEAEYGPGILQEFEVISRQTKKWTHEELERRIKETKAALEGLEK